MQTRVLWKFHGFADGAACAVFRVLNEPQVVQRVWGSQTTEQ